MHLLCVVALLATGAPEPPSNLSYELLPQVGASSVRFAWTSAPSAKNEVLEIGTLPGASNVLRITVPDGIGSYTWDGVPARSTFYAQVRAASSAGLSLPSNVVRVESLDLRDVIEAQFLGSGRLGTWPMGCVAWERWVAYPPGVTIRVRVSTTVHEAAQAAVQGAAELVSTATYGQNTAIVELTGETEPVPAENEVAVLAHPDPVSQGCTYARGCTIVELRDDFIVSARAILGIPEVAAYPHDAIGHGALGLCHIDGTRIGGARHSLMGSGLNTYSCNAPSDECIALSLTALDLEAVKAVYGSGLPRGSGRDAFVKAGLVNSGSGTTGTALAGPRRIRLGPNHEQVVIDH